MIEADGSALLEKDDNVDERAGVVPVAGMSWSQPTLICLVPTSHPAGFAWRKHDQWRQLGYVKPWRCRFVVDNCRSARPMASRTLILCRVHLAFEDRRAVFRMACSQLRKAHCSRILVQQDPPQHILLHPSRHCHFLSHLYSCVHNQKRDEHALTPTKYIQHINQLHPLVLSHLKLVPHHGPHQHARTPTPRHRSPRRDRRPISPNGSPVPALQPPRSSGAR